MKERIRKLRRALDLTQQEFSDRIGMKRNTVANYETGRNEPSASVISLICREFHVEETWLRTGEGDMFKSRLPIDEVGAYVEELLEYNPDDAVGKNPFYDMIIDMMRIYHDMDDKSQTVVRDYFNQVRESIRKEKV